MDKQRCHSFVASFVFINWRNNMNLNNTDYQAAINLLSNLININTPGKDENNLCCFVNEYLRNTNCKTEIRHLYDNTSNVISVIKGKSSASSIVLNGHIDTVPFGEISSWKYPPDKATIEGNRMYGRGTSDMKSGFGVLLYVFRILAESGFIPSKDIILIGTADEESGGHGATDIADSGLLDNTEEILIAEPTSCNIASCSKGTLWIKFSILGKTSHGAYPSEGINSIEVAYKLKERIKELISGHTHSILTDPTISLNKISGGTKINMVAETCETFYDIRTVPSINHKNFIKCIDEVVIKLQNQYSGLKITKSIITDRPPMETNTSIPFVNALKDSIISAGKAPEITGTSYFTDASLFLKKYNIPCVLFGPGDDFTCHKIDEYVDLNNYILAIKAYLDFLISFLS